VQENRSAESVDCVLEGFEPKVKGGVEKLCIAESAF
jgi:hypothetical protein